MRWLLLFSSVIVNDLNVIAVTVVPAKTETPLVVNTNAVLARPVALQSFQMISRRTGHIIQNDSAVQLAQFSLRNPFNGAEAGGALPLMETLRISTAEALDHPLKI